MYAHMHPMLHPGLRRIPCTLTGVPLSRSIWWEFFQRKVWRLGRTGAERARRAMKPEHQGVDRTPWPDPAETMRACPEWHETLRACAADSRLADLGIIHGDGLRAMVQDHLDGRARNHMTLGAWLTVEEWLRHYG